MLNTPALPDEWERIETVDAHAGGEPLRVITAGAPDLAGETILQQREEMRAKHDSFRRAVIHEPRGHTDMYGAILVDSTSESADIGALFLQNDGYSTMCGHGIIGLGTVLPETNMVPTVPGSEIIIDTPAGPVAARPEYDGNRVHAVSFQNVPSFVYAREQRVSVPGLGSIEFDIAYGGAYYAYVNASQADVRLEPGETDDLKTKGMAIKRAIEDTVTIEHPGNDDLGYLYGTIFSAPASSDPVDYRNVCIFADGQVDRSPTGTGVSGHLARRVGTGDLAIGETLTIESIIGTTFDGQATNTTEVNGTSAVIPEVTGTAHITGQHEFVIDPDDPLRDGFLLR